MPVPIETAEVAEILQDFPGEWEFSLVVRSTNGGAQLARQTISEADLIELESESWLDGCLRRGRPDIPFDSLRFRLEVQRENEGSSQCKGLHVHGQTTCGWRFDRVFGTEAFADVAARVRQRLIAGKVVQLDESISYEVHALPRSAAVDSTNDNPLDLSLTLESNESSIAYVTRPLRPLVAAAKRVGEMASEFPVIYTEEALAQAERFARRGAKLNPPIETGAVLIGWPGSCPETGEWYVIVCQVLEVQDAEEATFSLSYTGKSWHRIQNIVQAMRSQPATRACQIVGQCHGHNFPPAGGAPPCDACLTQTECHRRSDSASIDDRIWTQATFHRTPWALCHIYGTNARKENVQSLFTLRDNQLRPRGFHVVREADIATD